MPSAAAAATTAAATAAVVVGGGGVSGGSGVDVLPTSFLQSFHSALIYLFVLLVLNASQCCRTLFLDFLPFLIIPY